MIKAAITPLQAREARELLSWSRLRLAVRLGVSYTTVSEFEYHGRAVGAFDPNRARKILEAEGVEFVARRGGGAGVRLKKAAD